MSAERTATGQGRQTPQYAMIARCLRQRIREGVYPVGSHLPTESELCEEFTISRHTTREALRLLIEAGLIQRKQGSGSRVVASEPGNHYVHSMRSLDQLFSYAADTRLRFLDIRNAVPDEAAGLDDNTKWLRIEGLRLERDEDVPICFSLVYIPRKYAGLRKMLTKYQGAIYRLMEDHFGIEVAEVEQLIEVVKLPERAANSLGQPPESWAARVVRRYLDAGGNNLLASVNFHPVDNFSYRMRLSRNSGPLG